MAEQESKRARNGEKSALEQLKEFTVIVADTGEFSAIKTYHPQDATTNPSLLLKAAILPEYKPLVDDAVTHALESGGSEHEQLDLAMDYLSGQPLSLSLSPPIPPHRHLPHHTSSYTPCHTVSFGKKIAEIVPGYVSTEVDARLSFDTDATVARARRLIALYAAIGIDKQRILIKIASTYEGIRAGEILQREGINCNLTLLFSLVQAVACAEAGIRLISPFVGRILDWYKAKHPSRDYVGEEDPGVTSVKQIYRYFKKFGHHTIVMGASFRNSTEILCLAGCDRLTISPALLEELQNKTDIVVERKLDSSSTEYPGEKIPVDEKSFRYALNHDAMATEKLAEGLLVSIYSILPSHSPIHLDELNFTLVFFLAVSVSLCLFCVYDVCVCLFVFSSGIRGFVTDIEKLEVIVKAKLLEAAQQGKK